MGNDIEIIWIPIKSRDALNDKEIEEAQALKSVCMEIITKFKRPPVQEDSVIK